MPPTQDQELAREQRKVDKARIALVRSLDTPALIALAAKRLTNMHRNGQISEVLIRLQAIDGAASRLLTEMMIRSMTPMQRDDFHLELTTAVHTVPPRRVARSVLQDLAVMHLVDELS